MEEFYPSEIARLILGYLDEIKCTNSWCTFLEESADLQEHCRLLKQGKKCSTSVRGESLLDILKAYCALKSFFEQIICQYSWTAVLEDITYLQEHYNSHKQKTSYSTQKTGQSVVKSLKEWVSKIPSNNNLRSDSSQTDLADHASTTSHMPDNFRNFDSPSYFHSFASVNHTLLRSHVQTNLQHYQNCQNISEKGIQTGEICSSHLQNSAKESTAQNGNAPATGIDCSKNINADASSNSEGAKNRSDASKSLLHDSQVSRSASYKNSEENSSETMLSLNKPQTIASETPEKGIRRIGKEKIPQRENCEFQQKAIDETSVSASIQQPETPFKLGNLENMTMEEAAAHNEELSALVKFLSENRDCSESRFSAETNTDTTNCTNSQKQHFSSNETNKNNNEELLEEVRSDMNTDKSDNQINETNESLTKELPSSGHDFSEDNIYSNECSTVNKEQNLEKTKNLVNINPSHNERNKSNKSIDSSNELFNLQVNCMDCDPAGINNSDAYTESSNAAISSDNICASVLNGYAENSVQKETSKECSTTVTQDPCTADLTDMEMVNESEPAKENPDLVVPSKEICYSVENENTSLNKSQSVITQPEKSTSNFVSLTIQPQPQPQPQSTIVIPNPNPSTVLSFPTVPTFDMPTISSDLTGQNNIQYRLILNTPIAWNAPVLNGLSFVPSLPPVNIPNQNVYPATATVIPNAAKFETITSNSVINLKNSSAPKTDEACKRNISKVQAEPKQNTSKQKPKKSQENENKEKLKPTTGKRFYPKRLPRRKPLSLFSQTPKKKNEIACHESSGNNIPVLSISDSPCSSGQSSASKVVSRITNEFEEQCKSPVLKLLMTNAEELLKVHNPAESSHIRCLDFISESPGSGESGEVLIIDERNGSQIDTADIQDNKNKNDSQRKAQNDKSLKKNKTKKSCIRNENNEIPVHDENAKKKKVKIGNDVIPSPGKKKKTQKLKKGKHNASGMNKKIETSKKSKEVEMNIKTNKSPKKPFKLKIKEKLKENSTMSVSDKNVKSQKKRNDMQNKHLTNGDNSEISSHGEIKSPRKSKRLQKKLNMALVNNELPVCSETVENEHMEDGNYEKLKKSNIVLNKKDKQENEEVAVIEQNKKSPQKNMLENEKWVSKKNNQSPKKGIVVQNQNEISVADEKNIDDQIIEHCEMLIIDNKCDTQRKNYSASSSIDEDMLQQCNKLPITKKNKLIENKKLAICNKSNKISSDKKGRPVKEIKDKPIDAEKTDDQNQNKQCQKDNEVLFYNKMPVIDKSNVKTNNDEWNKQQREQKILSINNSDAKSKMQKCDNDNNEIHASGETDNLEGSIPEECEMEVMQINTVEEVTTDPIHAYNSADPISLPQQEQEMCLENNNNNLAFVMNKRKMTHPRKLIKQNYLNTSATVAGIDKYADIEKKEFSFCNKLHNLDSSVTVVHTVEAKEHTVKSCESNLESSNTNKSNSKALLKSSSSSISLSNENDNSQIVNDKFVDDEIMLIESDKKCTNDELPDLKILLDKVNDINKVIPFTKIVSPHKNINSPNKKPHEKSIINCSLNISRASDTDIVDNNLSNIANKSTEVHSLNRKNSSTKEKNAPYIVQFPKSHSNKKNYEVLSVESQNLLLDNEKHYDGDNLQSTMMNENQNSAALNKNTIDNTKIKSEKHLPIYEKKKKVNLIKRKVVSRKFSRQTNFKKNSSSTIGHTTKNSVLKQSVPKLKAKKKLQTVSIYENENSLNFDISNVKKTYSRQGSPRKLQNPKENSCLINKNPQTNLLLESNVLDNTFNVNADKLHLLVASEKKNDIEKETFATPQLNSPSTSKLCSNSCETVISYDKSSNLMIQNECNGSVNLLTVGEDSIILDKTIAYETEQNSNVSLYCKKGQRDSNVSSKNIHLENPTQPCVKNNLSSATTPDIKKISKKVSIELSIHNPASVKHVSLLSSPPPKKGEMEKIDLNDSFEIASCSDKKFSCNEENSFIHKGAVSKIQKNVNVVNIDTHGTSLEISNSEAAKKRKLGDSFSDDDTVPSKNENLSNHSLNSPLLIKRRNSRKLSSSSDEMNTTLYLGTSGSVQEISHSYSEDYFSSENIQSTSTPLLRDDTMHANNGEKVPSQSYQTQSKRIQDSPIKCPKKIRRVIHKTALSKKMEKDPNIPAGVKIPYRWNNSKIITYSNEIRRSAKNNNKKAKVNIPTGLSERPSVLTKGSHTFEPANQKINSGKQVLHQKSPVDYKLHDKVCVELTKLPVCMLNDKDIKDLNMEEKTNGCSNGINNEFEQTAETISDEKSEKASAVNAGSLVLCNNSPVKFVHHSQSTQDIVEADIGRSNVEGSELALAIKSCENELLASKSAHSSQSPDKTPGVLEKQIYGSLKTSSKRAMIEKLVQKFGYDFILSKLDDGMPSLDTSS